MSAASVRLGTPAADAAAISPGRVLAMLLCETRMEWLRLLRAPAFSVPTLVFPLMFYLLFGVALGAREPGTARHVLAALSAFGVMSPGLFGVGVTLAMDRERGLLELKRALPMPPGVYLGAKLIMAVLFACLVEIMMIFLAMMLGHVALTPLQWGELLFLAASGVLPFCALGLWVGTLARGQGAVAVLNLIYLPMSFLSGLWIPLSLLPQVLVQLAPLWPAYHLGQLALEVVGSGGKGESLGHVLFLVALTGACLFLASRRLGGSR
jgi:ABC-2 type transport system permease protein